MNSYTLSHVQFEQHETGQFYNWVVLETMLGKSGDAAYTVFKSYGGRKRIYRKDPMEFLTLGGVTNYFTKLNDGKLSEGYVRLPRRDVRFSSGRECLDWLIGKTGEKSVSWEEALEISLNDIVSYVGKFELGITTAPSLAPSLEVEIEPERPTLGELPAMIGSW